MDENMNQIPEQEPETTDAFLDGWDGEAEAAADQPEVDAEPMGGGEETPVEDPGESAETPGEGTQPPADTEQEAQTQQTEAETVDARPQTWELRHMGEVRQVNEAEMVALAQKGMDYDRIRSQYDEFKPVMEMVNHFANQQGLNTKDYISMLRAQAKQAEGLSEADARRSVELEDREAVVAAAEAERQAQQDAHGAGPAGRGRGGKPPTGGHSGISTDIPRGSKGSQQHPASSLGRRAERLFSGSRLRPVRRAAGAAGRGRRQAGDRLRTAEPAERRALHRQHEKRR